MRWSIVRLIWLRELRDQLRDRRTIFMVVVLPLLLYPLLGFGVLQFALGLGRQPSTVGVVGADNLPAAPPPAPPGASPPPRPPPPPPTWGPWSGARATRRCSPATTTASASRRPTPTAR